MTGALLDHLWQSTLFGIAIWSITLFLRGNSAAVRHWLWLAASVKFLLPLSALYWWGAVAGIRSPVDAQPAFVATALDSAGTVVSPAMTIGVTAPDAWLPMLAGIWLLGVGWLAARWIRDWCLANNLANVARPAPDSLPDILVTEASIAPSVARVFHPMVLLPAALIGRLPPSPLQAVLAHEREHIARHDNLKAQVHRLVETLFWFHPLVWFIGRQLLEEREQACDEAVLAQGHPPDQYAAGILEVCRHCAGAPAGVTASALAGDLPRRIGHILAGGTPHSLGFLKAFALSMSAILVAMVPLYAGTVDGATRHRMMVDRDMRVLWSADSAVIPANDAVRTALMISEKGNQLEIRSTSLRELVALAYGVDSHDVHGRGDWLDDPRYDIRVSLPEAVSAPEDFDPIALRPFATRLLAARFNLEIHVNQLCQNPCGPRALNASH